MSKEKSIKRFTEIIANMDGELKKLQAENEKMWHENRALIKKNELIVKSSSTGILTGIVGSIYIQDRLLELEAENKKLRECVEFYIANPDNEIWGLYESDYGNKARKCLKELEEGE